MKGQTSMQTTELLRDIPLFKGLSEESLNRLEAASTLRRLEKHEMLLAAGQPPQAFSVVLTGQIKFFRINRAGKEQVFGYASPGSIFGLTSLTDPYRPVPVNSMARMVSEIIEIELPVMRDVLHREPSLAIAVLKEQSRRYSSMLELADQLSLMDAHNRLAHWLDQWVSDNYPDAGDQEMLVVLPYTQSEIAAQIGTVREVVSRGFSRMEAEGYIRSSGKRITLLDRKGLRKMAEQ
jgi:CRP-like cAMP-binding protein